MKESSSIKNINAPIERVYATLSNLENLRPLLDKAQNDEDIKEKMREAGQENALNGLQKVVLTADSIEIPAPMVGTLSMRIIDREENKCIKFETEKSPVKANMWIQVLPVDSATCKMKLTVDADVPFMLKPMIGSKLKDGVEKVASAIAMIKY
jgi:carbon monoxide dehydrogenase subunit G